LLQICKIELKIRLSSQKPLKQTQSSTNWRKSLLEHHRLKKLCPFQHYLHGIEKKTWDKLSTKIHAFWPAWTVQNVSSTCLFLPTSPASASEESLEASLELFMLWESPSRVCSSTITRLVLGCTRLYIPPPFMPLSFRILVHFQWLPAPMRQTSSLKISQSVKIEKKLYVEK